MEHGQVSSRGLAAITFTNVDHANGKLALLHLTHLRVTGVRSEDNFAHVSSLNRILIWVSDEKGFPFVTSGMILGHVQRFESKVIPISFRVTLTVKTKFRKNGHDVLNRLRGEVH